MVCASDQTEGFEMFHFQAAVGSVRRHPPTPKATILRWRGGIVLGVVVLLGGLASRASAHDYPEHAHATHVALRSLAEQDLDLLRVYWAALVELLGGHRPPLVCDDAMTTGEPRCFALSELPALAGDHAASAGLLLWRWLDSSQDQATDVPGMLVQGIQAAVPNSRQLRSPETAMLRMPDREGLLRSRLDYEHGHWPISREAAEDLDTLLASIDDSYARLATRGHPHFRPGVQAPDRRLVSNRIDITRSEGRPWHKPENQAYAWYADQHLGALYYAAAARVEVSPETRREYMAASLLFEMSALHYLQDATSAGHIGIVAGRHNNYSLNRIHDAHGESGLDVRIPATLCSNLCNGGDSCAARATFAPLCDHVDATLRLHGDGWSMSAADAGTRETEETLWASIVSYFSLREVLGVARDGFRAPLADVSITDVASETASFCSCTGGHCSTLACCDGAAPGALAIQRRLHQWWETSSALCSRREQLRRAYDAEYFDALRRLPMLVEAPTSDLDEVRFVGRGAYLSGMLAAARERDSGNVQLVPVVSAGIRFLLPRNLVPLSIAFLVTIASPEDPRVFPTIAVSVSPKDADRLFFELQGGWGRRGSSTGWMIAGMVGYSIVERETSQAWLGLRLGALDTDQIRRSAFVGVELGFAIRRRIPSPHGQHGL